MARNALNGGHGYKYGWVAARTSELFPEEALEMKK